MNQKDTKVMEKIRKILATIALVALLGWTAEGQVKTWSLEDCISYALAKNIQVKKADLTNGQNLVNAGQAKMNRLPSLNANVSQNFSWYKGFDSATGQNGVASGSNSTNYSLNSNVVLFNGDKLSNRVRLAALDLEGGKYNSDAVRESVGLNILNGYLQVLYSSENVSNARKQIESTSHQLELAGERLNQGAISMADYLQIKSELATEKSTLASAESQLAINKVSLMQLMELPVDQSFDIVIPRLDSLVAQPAQPSAQEIYNLALGFKPQVKSAELNTQGAAVGVSIAKADYLPTLSLGAGLSTGYSSLIAGSGYTTQLNNKINPSVGLTLSIPIFQKKQVRTNVSLANIAVSNAQLDEVNTKNTLRKEIEQACVDVTSARSEYAAGQEQLGSAQESYNVADEKFRVGLINSVDLLVQKNNVIASEIKLLQSKYKLIFSYKVLDFYKGTPLVL